MNIQDTKTKVAILALNSGYATEYEQFKIKEYTGLDSKAVEGVYKGVKETSFVVPYTTQDDLSGILELARDHKQESVLLLTEDRRAYLYFLSSGETKHLGEFINATELEAMSSDNYTYDPVYREYYITKEV